MQQKRKCRFADASNKDVDLRQFAEEIEDTINKTVPGKHPEVHKDYYITDTITRGEAIRIGQALSKLQDLAQYGKSITTFRLFNGTNIAIADATEEQKTMQKEGGHYHRKQE